MSVENVEEKPYVFSFDCESNGLYGECWSVGITIIKRLNMQPIVRYLLIVDPIDMVTDNWVIENVIPAISVPTEKKSIIYDNVNKNVPIKKYLHSNTKKMRNKFWNIWMKYKNKSICVVDCGIPVESHFLFHCVYDDLENRMWNAPFPAHEVATMFYANGLDAINTDRNKYSGLNNLLKHNPEHDAYASGICWCKLYNLLYETALDTTLTDVENL